ncbi:Homeobox protein knotted-1-like [Actinidia chinensis var. chinensis]|uniref:Homeobox protein knotted-1-like n=1 Tax=Actinidia chinensis var. chinensis TaxID=1590841 RepID=A0A2R6P770_ACTCC|nr:Homeobox protein knotted-1-like [Actinidia chinensis var. chinensis]
MRTTTKMALSLLQVLFLHLNASSHPSQTFLVSAFNQQQQKFGDKRSLGIAAIKGGIGGATSVERRGGGGGGHGGGGGGGHGGGGHGHIGGRGRPEGKGLHRYRAVIPLYAAGAGAGAHPDNNRYHHHGKNGCTATGIRLPVLAFAIMASLFLLAQI